MKTTVGTLRKLVKEVAIGNDIYEAEGLKVGTWYVMKPEKWKPRGEGVVELIRLEPSGKDADAYLMATYTAGGDYTGRQRFDFWKERVEREATPEEVKQAQEGAAADRAYMSAHIDTSKEGT